MPQDNFSNISLTSAQESFYLFFYIQYVESLGTSEKITGHQGEYIYVKLSENVKCAVCLSVIKEELVNPIFPRINPQRTRKGWK